MALNHQKGIGSLLRGFNHIAIVVSDVRRSLEFYEGVLGFRRIHRPHIHSYDGAWLVFGNIELHLLQGKPTPPPEATDPENMVVPHLSFESASMAETIRALGEQGIPITKVVLHLHNDLGDENSRKAETTQLFIRDPDGYYIEICTCGPLKHFCFGPLA